MLVDPYRGTTQTVSIQTRRSRLDAGDYALDGHPAALIERKASIEEATQNCLTHDRPRFVAALKRLRDACTHPYLVLEGTPLDLLSPSARTPKPFMGLDALLRLCLEYRVTPMILPSSSISARRAIGETITRLLINASLLPRSSSTMPASPGVPDADELPVVQASPCEHHRQ